MHLTTVAHYFQKPLDVKKITGGPRGVTNTYLHSRTSLGEGINKISRAACGNGVN
jgi:hypothetical protein